MEVSGLEVVFGRSYVGQVVGGLLITAGDPVESSERVLLGHPFGAADTRRCGVSGRMMGFAESSGSTAGRVNQNGRPRRRRSRGS
jgi:hypothetical protein